jgi:nitroreductase
VAKISKFFVHQNLFENFCHNIPQILQQWMVHFDMAENLCNLHPFKSIKNMYEQFSELVRTRESVRSYLPEPVNPESIERILEAARLSPSACNAQPWTFIVVNEPELKNRLADATSNRAIGLNHFTKQAPIHLVIVMEPGNLTSRFGSMVKHKHFPLIDIGIAAEHICLAATAEGLGTCMIGWFDEAAVRKLLAIPASKRPILIITLGHPVQPGQREKKRKLPDEVIRYNGYTKKSGE